MVGVRVRSKGTVERPHVESAFFFRRRPDEKDLAEAKRKLEWTLSTREATSEFYAMAEVDPILRKPAKKFYGMHETPFPDLFTGIQLAVALQMAPIKRSNQMMNALITEYGDTVSFDGRSVRSWPSHKRIAAVTVRELKAKCRLGYRAKILKGIARRLCRGFVSVEDLARMRPEEATKKLMELKGIGE